MDLQQAVRLHLHRCAVAGLSEKTIVNYEITLNRLASGLPPHPKMEEVLECVLALRAGFSPNTYRKTVTHVRTFFHAWRRFTHDDEDKLLCKEVLEHLRRPRAHDTDVRIPTQDEVEALIEHTWIGHQGWRDHLALCVMADLGCRVGELCVLRWDDVELGRGVVHVGQKQGRRRVLPITLPKRLYQAFIKRHKYYERQRRRQGTPEPHYAMSRTISRPVERNTIAGMLRKHCTTLGIKPAITPHQLRYYFGARHADTMSLLVMQEYLGHANLHMTLHYLNKAGISVERMRAAMERSLQLTSPMGDDHVSPRVLA